MTTTAPNDSPAAPTREHLAQQVSDLEGRVKVDAALIGRLTAEGVIDQAKIAHLESALISARRCGAAIGILMTSQRLTEADAFMRLVERSQNTHIKLRDIADDVVLTGELTT